MKLNPVDLPAVPSAWKLPQTRRYQYPSVKSQPSDILAFQGEFYLFHLLMPEA